MHTHTLVDTCIYVYTYIYMNVQKHIHTKTLHTLKGRQNYAEVETIFKVLCNTHTHTYTYIYVYIYIYIYI